MKRLLLLLVFVLSLGVAVTAAGAGLVEYKSSPALQTAVHDAASDAVLPIVTTLDSPQSAVDVAAVSVGGVATVVGNQVISTMTVDNIIQISNWDTVTWIDLQ